MWDTEREKSEGVLSSFLYFWKRASFWPAELVAYNWAIACWAAGTKACCRSASDCQEFGSNHDLCVGYCWSGSPNEIRTEGGDPYLRHWQQSLTCTLFLSTGRHTSREGFPIGAFSKGERSFGTHEGAESTAAASMVPRRNFAPGARSCSRSSEAVFFAFGAMFRRTIMGPGLRNEVFYPQKAY